VSRRHVPHDARAVARVELHDTILTVSVSPSAGRAYFDVRGHTRFAVDGRELRALRNALEDMARIYDVCDLRAALDDAARALDEGDGA
jgi:hypothetical protein